MKPLCTSCAATEADGATFPQHVRGRPRFCGACQDQQRRDAEAQLWVDRHHAISRASYRARLRNRRASAQMDLIDGLVPTP